MSMIHWSNNYSGGEGDQRAFAILWKKGETYDQILKRIMSLAEYEGFMEKQYERLKDKEAFLSLNKL